ncbi:MAG: helix-turn-helix transcriptional regulator [Gammaproteobacteria bacterium]|nr:helix-turn-helix transcriptional regulator [Gammaproteobacteria bacterium]
MHIAFRLAPEPIRVYRSDHDPHGDALSWGVVGGARSSAFFKDVLVPARSVGAMLRPGAASALLGCAADSLAERHLPLSAFWGDRAHRLGERLMGIGDAEEALALFEAALLARLPRVRGLHPAVAAALEHFTDGEPVAAAHAASGYSQRGFIALFRREVGLAPKRYCRVLRLQQTLAHWSEAPASGLADLALQAGYSDQAHFQREFRALTGITPGTFRTLSPSLSHHVPLTSDSFNPNGAEVS